MSRGSTKPPSGMRDFLPEDIARRDHVVSVVRSVYRAYGFVPLETPAIENLATLLGNYGEDEKLIYKVLHRGEVLKRALDAEGDVTEADLADQALRYDLTVPLARVVAQYADLPRFFKRFQIQPVWRADRPGKGRFREFYQCDVDVVGTESQIAEAEVCAAVADVLRRLGFADFEIKVNHRGLLRGLIRTAGIADDRESTALIALDKLDKIGREAVEKELTDRGIAAESASKLLEMVLTEAPDDPGRVAQLREALTDEGGLQALDQLESLFELLGSTPAAGTVRFSPRLARGLGYYTGPIFEVGLPDFPSSVAGGGRYDQLIGMFGKKDIPAVGFSIGLERILVVMQDRGMFPDLGIGPDVMVCWRGVTAAQSVEVGHKLRAQGLRVEVFPEPSKLGKQVQYADGAGAQVAAVLGEKELAAGEIALKHLASGEQVTVPVAEAAKTVQAWRGRA